MKDINIINSIDEVNTDNVLTSKVRFKTPRFDEPDFFERIRAIGNFRNEPVRSDVDEDGMWIKPSLDNIIAILEFTMVDGSIVVYPLNMIILRHIDEDFYNGIVEDSERDVELNQLKENKEFKAHAEMLVEKYIKVGLILKLEEIRKELFKKN